jgi:hypothetical protein
MCRSEWEILGNAILDMEILAENKKRRLIKRKSGYVSVTQFV